MTIRDVVNDRHNRGTVPIRGRRESGLASPRGEMKRLFDEFFNESWLLPFRLIDQRIPAFTPRVNVKETEKEISVSAELPGLDEKDIELTLDDNVLTIKGEKKEEQEEKDETSYRMERTYGSFHRSIPLPVEIDVENVKARFKKGVLAVKVPKLKPDKAKRKTIDISAD